MAWGATYYIHGEWRPLELCSEVAVCTDPGEVGRGCLDGRRDQEGLRLGHQNGGTRPDQILGSGDEVEESGEAVRGPGEPEFPQLHILPRGGSGLSFVSGGREFCSLGIAPSHRRQGQARDVHQKETQQERSHAASPPCHHNGGQGLLLFHPEKHNI